MKITVFTCNSPRHISLINALSGIADTVYAVHECKTIFPGQVKDRYQNTPVMDEYFRHVIKAEHKIFGNVGFSKSNVRTLSVKSGDLSRMEISILSEALESDYYIVFGAGFIKGDLIDFLVKKRAYNIHIGVSPYYRGSSCNFWASYDGNTGLIGATIHLLSSGLDSGDILYHALPKAGEYDPFDLGMEAVRAAHISIVEMIKTCKIKDFTPVKQDKTQEIRYSRNAEFTDETAEKYLSALPTPREIAKKLQTRDINMFTNPYISNNP